MITINIEGIEIEVQRKKMKNMAIRICAPDGNVKISAPLRCSNIAIRRFAELHIEWIHKNKLAYQASYPTQAYRYDTGERHSLQGREYILRVHEGSGKPKASITEDTYIDLFVPIGASPEYRQNVLTKTYRQLLSAHLAAFIPQWEEKIGVRAENYQVRRMKARWGTCHPQKRKIYLNLSLIKYPIACLEYVLVHELVHFLEPSHNFRFKALMDRFLPDWRIHKAVLNN